jgi:hypothetical protein
MLYMVIATHGPGTCAAYVEPYKQKAQKAFAEMDEVGKTHGITVKGSWVAWVAHTLYIVVDAPGGHAIQDFVGELELPAWNKVVMHPVDMLQAVMEKTKDL